MDITSLRMVLRCDIVIGRIGDVGGERAAPYPQGKPAQLGGERAGMGGHRAHPGVSAGGERADSTRENLNYFRLGSARYPPIDAPDRQH